MSPEKERRAARARSAGAAKGSGGARSQRAKKTPQEPRGKLRSMLEYEGVTRSKGAQKPQPASETNEKRPRPRNTGKSKLRAVFEYEGVTRQEARTKEALRESEQKLRVIFDSIAAGITITDLEGNIVEMNSGALRLHGFSSKDEVIGKSGLELIAEKDRARALKNWMARLAEEDTTGVPDYYTLLKADGSEFEAAVSEALLRDKHGEPEGFISIARDITERKRAEELVRASEAKLRAMFESIEDAVTIVDLEGNILEVNDVMCRMSGYSREKLIGKSGWDIIDPEYRDTIVNDLLKQIKGEAPKEALAYKFSTPDGREYYAELHVSVIRDSSGKATGFLTIHNDITERRQMQEALQESEEMARGMLESAATGIYLVQDRVFQYASPLFEEISGYNSSELIGRNPLDYVHPEDREPVRRKAIEDLKGRSSLPHEFRFMRKDGESVWILEKVASIEYQGKPAAIASFMDITEQKRAEAELEKSAEKLRIIIESIGDMLFVTDLELNFVNVNDSAVRLLGYSKEEDLIGKSAVDCIAEKDRSRVAVDMGKALAAQSGVENIEYTLLTSDGKEIDAESNVDILRDCSGMVVGLIITARDITERKRMQEAVRASEEKLHIMFESIHDGIVVTDLLGNITEANEATASMTGYPREKLLGLSGLDLISPEYHQMAAEVMGKVFEGQQATASLELKFVTANGAEVDAEFSTSVLYDGAGNATGFVSITRDIGERKRMEAELEKSAEKLRLVIESIGDMLFITDLDLNFSNVNESAVRQLGYTNQEELAGKNAMEPVVEEDRTRVAIELGKALAEERGIEAIEYTLQAADGRKFDVESNAEILRDGSDMVVGLIISARDVTERKQMQEAIRGSEEKLRGIFNTIPDGVTFTDMYGTILELNEAMVHLYGHSNKEGLIGRNAIDFVVEEYRDTVVLLGLQAIKEGHDINRIAYKILNAAGKQFDVELYAAPLRDSSGEPIAWVNVSRDITERKKAEEAIRESEQRFRVIFESIVDGLTVTDLNGNIVDMNDAALQLHGYSDKQQLIGKNTIEYMVAEVDRERTVNEALEAIKEDRPLERAEYRLQKADGTEFEGEFSTAILRDDAGEAAGHIGMTRDITEHKQAEETIRQSEEKLRLTFEAMGDAITVSDLNGNVLDVNELAYRKAGYSSKEEFIGKNGFDLISPEDRDRITKTIVQALKEGLSSVTMECMLHPIKGDDYQAEVTISVIRDAAGNATGFINASRDITERKRTEEALLQSEEKLSRMFASMRDAIVLTDTTGTIVEVNDATVSMHGFSSREEIIGRNGIELVAESDRKKVAEAAIKQSKGEIQEGIAEHHMLLRADGTEFESESSRAILKDSAGNTTGFISVERDISERRQAEEAVRESEERLKAFIDNAPDAIYVMDMNGTFMDGNKKTEELVGYAKEELAGMNFYEAGLLPEEYALQALGSLQQSQSGQATAPTEFELIRKDGSRVWVEVRSIPVSRKGEVEVLGIARDITERKRAAEALEDSESRFRELFENMSSAVAVYEVKNKGKDFIFRDLNSAGERISKLKKYEVLGKNLVEMFPNIKKGGIYQTMQRVWKSGKPEYIPPTFYKDDRISGWRENYVYKLPTGEVVAVYDDVTERLRAEEAIRESEEKLRTMFDSTNDAFIITDLETNVIDVNEATLRTFRYTREDIIGIKGTELIDPEDLEQTVESMSKALETGQPPDSMELTILTGDGGRLETDFSIAPLHDSSGNTTGFVAVARDITEHKRAEQALRESEEKLRTMFDSTSDGILVTDQALSIIETNEAAVRMLGFDSKEALVGQSAISYLSAEALTADAEGGDGKAQIEFSVSQLRDSSGNTTGFIGVARDVTERKKAEAQMKRMLEDLERSNAELEQFAYIASHDLQEPLRMISSYTQLIGRRYKDKLDADGEEFIEYAVDGATRMQDRIQALLTYSRVGTRGKEFEPTDCDTVLEEALSNLQVAIKKSGSVISHDPLPTITADNIQMVQLFQNLIENGIKFHDEKQPEVHVSAKEQEDGWLFSVRDNGIGIDPEYSDRIFLIFKRLHAKGEYAGTGVGLALCKKIVERHGGRIWVESEPGKGATFYFTTPKEIKEED